MPTDPPFTDPASSTSARPEACASRYHRQMILPQVGAEGQRRIGESTATIVGVGALGTVSSNLLARAGVGTVRLIDRDLVDRTNLQRQMLYTEADAAAGRPKAEAAAERLAAANSQIRIQPFAEDLTPDNAERLLSGCDVLVDGLDNFEGRYLVNDVAVKLGIPWVYGGALGGAGVVMPILPRRESSHGSTPWVPSSCLRCLFDQASGAGDGGTCDTVGVLGMVTSLVGSWQASEALKMLIGDFDAVSRDLVRVEMWGRPGGKGGRGGREQRVDMREARRDDCPCCGLRRFDYLEGEAGRGSAELCGRDAVQVRTHRAGETYPPLNLESLRDRLVEAGVREVALSRFVLRFRPPAEFAPLERNAPAIELSVFRDGRVIVRGTTRASVARAMVDRYVGG